MNDDFFSERLARLRLAKGVSARDMSLSLGQSPNYINKIEAQKAYPSMSAFYNICEYLGISERDFFDEDNQYPVQFSDLISDLKKLDGQSLEHIAGIVKKIAGKNK